MEGPKFVANSGRFKVSAAIVNYWAFSILEYGTCAQGKEVTLHFICTVSKWKMQCQIKLFKIGTEWSSGFLKYLGRCSQVLDVLGAVSLCSVL